MAKAAMKIQQKTESKTPAKVKVEKKSDEKVATIQSLRTQITKTIAEMKVGKVKDVRTVAKLRDQLARMLTIERMKELGEV